MRVAPGSIAPHLLPRPLIFLIFSVIRLDPHNCQGKSNFPYMHRAPRFFSSCHSSILFTILFRVSRSLSLSFSLALVPSFLLSHSLSHGVKPCFILSILRKSFVRKEDDATFGIWGCRVVKRMHRNRESANHGNREKKQMSLNVMYEIVVLYQFAFVLGCVVET